MAALANLVVYTNEGQPDAQTYEELPRTSTRYRTVRQVVDRALLLHESARGVETLINLAQLLVRELWSSRSACLYPRNDPNFRRLPGIINFFLRQMRSNFPAIYLGRIQGEAMAIRRDWAVNASTLEDFFPRTAADLKIHWHVSCVCPASRTLIDA